MIKVKICGIKTLDTALTAILAGTDYLGFNFVHTSKNYIKPERAKEIIDVVRGIVEVVGFFQNERLEKVQEISQNLGLDLVQLHGVEDNDYCQKIGKPVIKAFMVPSEFNEEKVEKEIEDIKVDFYMLDREKRGVGGILNPIKVKELVSSGFPIFLAGGLTSGNILEVLGIVKLYAVDVSSGVETEGVKDNEKIKSFIEMVKRKDSGLRQNDDR